LFIFLSPIDKLTFLSGSVVRPALLALAADDVEGYQTLVETVVALDAHHLVLVLRRHNHACYLYVHMHLEELRVTDRLAAERACDVCLDEAFVTAAMHRVPAAQKN